DPGPRERRAGRGHRVRRGRSGRPPRGVRERGRADGRRVARGPSVGSVDRRRRRDRQWGERRPRDRDQRTGPGRIGHPAPRHDPRRCGGPVDVRDRRIRGTSKRVAHPVGRPEAAPVPRVRQRGRRDHLDLPAREEATRKALHETRGSYAILAIHADEPGKVVGARNESPLVVGVGPDENFLASDVPALLRYTDRVLYVMDKEMVVITPKGVSLTDLEGKAVARDPQRITWSLEDAEKGGFDHFMLKEIHEAPKAIHETLLGRLAN